MIAVLVVYGTRFIGGSDRVVIVSQSVINHNTESPSYFTISSKILLNHEDKVSKVGIKLQCSSVDMKITTIASQRDDAVVLCPAGSLLDMYKNAEGEYTIIAEGNSKVSGSIDVNIFVYDVDGKILATDERVLIFEPITI